MTMRKLRIAAVLGGLLYATPSWAQDIDNAVRSYNDDKFADAAYLFFDVAQNTDDIDDRYRAEYYLGHSLYRAGYLLPAFQFYGEVFNQGEEHPYFLRATKGLLRVAEGLQDDLIVPEVINRGYTNSFAQLEAEDLNAINYMIGLLSERQADLQAASDFFRAITDESSPYYKKAQYHLAIIQVQVAIQQGQADYSEAIEIFSRLQALTEDSLDEEDKKLYRLATLGKARAYYSQGDFERSIASYEQVTRFSNDWFESLDERGWSYFQAAQFGNALGAVHSVHAPYFDDRLRPESFVLKATTYFQVCHFDRVRKTLDDFFAVYEPVNDQLKTWLENQTGDEEVVRVLSDGAPNFPEEVRLRVIGNKKFSRYLGILDKVDQELERAKANFPDGNFKGILITLLQDQQAQWQALTGRLGLQLINNQYVAVDDFLNQARIIQFETSDAERKMLEAGKDITKGPRAKGPRPFVPNATYQYWAFQGEYWIDELGYYQHSIKDECIPEVFQ